MDIDECAEGTHNCDEGAKCNNTNGSFTCTCMEGYTGNGTTCVDNDECDLGTNNCDQKIRHGSPYSYDYIAALCTNTIGSFTCTCPEGYNDKYGNGSGCNDIDECKGGMHQCGDHGSCQNWYGTYTCHCNRHYTFDKSTKRCVRSERNG